MHLTISVLRPGDRRAGRLLLAQTQLTVRSSESGDEMIIQIQPWSLTQPIPLLDGRAQAHQLQPNIMKVFTIHKNVVMCLQNNFCQPQLLPSENFISPACHFIPTSGLLNHACWGPDKVSHFNIRLSKMLRLSTFQATRTVWSGGQRGVWRVLHQPMFGPAHVPGHLVYHHVIII